MFFVRRNVKTLSHLKMQHAFHAQSGRPGAGRNRDGAKGDDAEIPVPPGTVITDAETGERLADLNAEGERIVVLTGGRGGKGNAHFKSSRHQTPRFSQPGEETEARTVRVEMQIIADIGFVGLPNVGKSTLLKVLTAAQPKVGNYPFTTVIPNLGVHHVHDRDLVLADIPGIIEGASAGAGLGVRFLKHIARTRGLAFVVDAGDPDPVATVTTLEHELATYDAAFTVRPRLMIVSRADATVDGGAAARGELQHAVDAATLRPPTAIVVTSAVTRVGIADLSDALVRLVAAVEEVNGVVD